MKDEFDFLKMPLANIQDEITNWKPINLASFRGTQSAPCPGISSNVVTLAVGDWAKNGIGRPKNIGTCPIHLAYYDKNGIYLGHHTLQPNEQSSSLITPINTYIIKFGCSKYCTGKAVIEYDVINIA